jgi:large subunit ribosomal protein L15
MKAPKLRGFTSFQKKVETVTLTTVERVAQHTKKITPATLYNDGVISRPTSLVKIVGTGVLKTAVTVEGCQASKTALAAIEAAGGKMVF